MKPSPTLVTVAVCLAVGAAGAARAGAPLPDTRQGDFAHLCQGGPNRDLACSVATQDADCPGSRCVVQALSKSIKGTLTLIAHDDVTDWATGAAANRAVTVLLEVKGPDGSPRLLAATYQDLLAPENPPRAPNDVVSIEMDEAALKALGAGVGGLLFVRPESQLAAQLQSLFGATGTPALTAVRDRQVLADDHTGDGLATVLRFKVKLQFLAPA